MMRWATWWLLMACLLPAARAQGHATPEEATALVRKAVAFYKQKGREAAFAEFSNPKGQFVDRELYILVFNLDGVNLAHGNNARLIGKNLLEMKDVDGKPIIRNFIEIARTKGKGWYDYKWPNPVTKAIELKSTYLERVDDVLIGTGIYR
jgi:hypothetical protein